MGIPNTRGAALPLQVSSLLRPHYSALDGVRAVAFGLVFLWHYGYLLPHFEGNPMRKCLGIFLDWTWIGVGVFFVVSGFLINGILYDSVTKKKYFRNFYIRRSLRIFPLFYSFWLITILLTPILHTEWNRYVSLMALYLGNSFIASRTQFYSGADPFPFRERFTNVATINKEHFWSLCVEEQFYLAWSAVIWFARSRKSLLRLCV